MAQFTNKLIVAYFYRANGDPYTGLTPTIRIWQINPTGADTLIIGTPSGTVSNIDEPMTEVGDGFYKFNFTPYDYTKLYGIRMDGGNVPQIGVGRYGVAVNGSFYQDLSHALWQETLSDHTDVDTTGEALGNASTAGSPANPNQGGMA